MMGSAIFMNGINLPGTNPMAVLNANKEDLRFVHSEMICVVRLHLALPPGDLEICILLILEMLGSDMANQGTFCRSSALTLALVAALCIFAAG